MRPILQIGEHVVPCAQMVLGINQLRQKQTSSYKEVGAAASLLFCDNTTQALALKSSGRSRPYCGCWHGGVYACASRSL